MSHADGLLAVASMVVVCSPASSQSGALGGYALEHRLEIVGTVVAIVTVSAAVLSLAISPPRSRRVNLVALLVVWPLDLVLV